MSLRRRVYFDVLLIALVIEGCGTTSWGGAGELNSASP